MSFLVVICLLSKLSVLFLGCHYIQLCSHFWLPFVAKSHQHGVALLHKLKADGSPHFSWKCVCFVTVGTACSPARHLSLPVKDLSSYGRKTRNSPFPCLAGSLLLSHLFLLQFLWFFKESRKAQPLWFPLFSENPVLSPHGLAFVKFAFEKRSVLWTLIFMSGNILL